ncbi:MAG: TonB-dependent receptor, partial [Novosphingobium sp.]|nr:TonB-dependent receptor [Novosphingobium sp.]
MERLAQDSVSGPLAQGAETAEGGDIIVTAQRRSERLVDVPASVVAISGEALAQAGTNGIADLTRQAPGVIINTTGAYTQP